MSAGILLPNQLKRLEQLLDAAAVRSSDNPNTEVRVSVIFRNGYPRVFESTAQEKCIVPDEFKKNF